MFEENQSSLDDLGSALHKGCYVASMNEGEVSFSPFILSGLKMDQDRRGIRVGLISVIPVEDAVFCEELVLNRVQLITFTISDIVEDGIILCILILYLEALVHGNLNGRR